MAMLVYISHSRQNSGAALRLADQLQSQGVKTWLDVRDLEPGVAWKSGIAEVIRKAEAIVFLIGPPGCEDQGQKYEWEQVVEEEYYLDPAKLLIPVVMGDAEIPGFLKARRAIRVGESAISFETIASEIAESLKHPEKTIDHDQIERGRNARRKAQEDFLGYSRELEAQAIKRAGLQGLK